MDPRDLYIYEDVDPGTQGTCYLHRIAMLEDVVPTTSGFGEDGIYSGARAKHFPNSRRSVNGGCITATHPPQRVLYCPECRRVEEEMQPALEHKIEKEERAMWEHHRAWLEKNPSPQMIAEAQRKAWGDTACEGCGGKIATWGDSSRAVCSLCRRPLPPVPES